MARDRIRIGCGAGFADDRIPPGVEIVERGELDYLAMECLAERTIARETLDRAKDPAKGYTPVLLERMEAIMPPALRRGIKIVTNMGAANPMGAARAVRKHVTEWDCPNYTCAVVTGDEVTEVMRAHPELPLMEDGTPLKSLLPRMASANAYLGADVVARGFATGAELVITGRVADPALFLAPMLHAFGWSYDDYAKLATVRSRVICWNAPANSPAAASPILARRKWRTSLASVIRWRMYGRMAVSRLPRRLVPVGGSTLPPARNNCSMKCTIPARTLRPTACWTCPR